jgi:hypothetical protein
MDAEFENLPEDEQLKAENDFMKMKMMLENGAHFGSMQGGENGLDPAIENMFLKNVMAFEKNFAEGQKLLKLFDKIGRPTQFIPVNEIPAGEFEAAWAGLDEYLQLNGICLSACSPKVTAKELYRFTVEELFDHEMDDFAMPGFTSHFTYDEFYPDIEYEHTNIAVDDCIKAILRKDSIEWMTYFKSDNLTLNNNLLLSEDGFKEKVNFFKQAYDEIDNLEVAATSFWVRENSSTVKGNYSFSALIEKDTIQLSGDWEVAFEQDADFEYWHITNVQIAGIQF